ncbi:hypothetical protein CHARACLAT_008633 [Characodon lateralis]|uniref:Uncharacterized protein n=1 Tax=Characodon lateralis TaxID=208331 RepID=A0ABU7EIT2_9TELE|nr:hypothetical protein [Characodon lateralis]
MRQSHRQVKTHAQRRPNPFVSVFVCTLQKYTAYTYSIFNLCINLTRSLEKKTSSKINKKKKYSRVAFKKEIQQNRFSQDTLKKECLPGVLISGRFQEVASVSCCVNTVLHV